MRHVGLVDDVLPWRNDAVAVVFEADHLNLGVSRNRTGAACGGAVGRRVQQAVHAVGLAVDLGGVLERRFDDRLLLQPEPTLVELAVVDVLVAARQALSVRGVGVRPLLGRLTAGALLRGRLRASVRPAVVAVTGGGQRETTRHDGGSDDFAEPVGIHYSHFPLLNVCADARTGIVIITSYPLFFNFTARFSVLRYRQTQAL